MQTLKGTWAVGPTKREVNDILERLVPIAEKIMADNAKYLDNPEECDPVYSLDNPSIHDKASLTDLGIVEGQNTFPLPAYGGDMHKVIEHIHGQMVGWFQRFMSQCRDRYPPKVYRDQLEGMFWGKVAAESVARDVNSLKATLECIAKPVAQGGTGGDWAPRPLS